MSMTEFIILYMFFHPVLKCMNAPSTFNILLYERFWDKKEAGLINNFSLKYLNSCLSKGNQPLLLLWSTKSYLYDKKAHSSAARCYRSPSVSRTNVRFVPLKRNYVDVCLFHEIQKEEKQESWSGFCGVLNQETKILPNSETLFLFFFKYSKTKVTGV